MPLEQVHLIAAGLPLLAAAGAIAIACGRLAFAPRIAAYRWITAVTIMVGVTLVLYLIGSHTYSNWPATNLRPDKDAHFGRPPGNSFPSHHAMLAAAAAAMVG